MRSIRDGGSPGVLLLALLVPGGCYERPSSQGGASDGVSAGESSGTTITSGVTSETATAATGEDTDTGDDRPACRLDEAELDDCVME